jgi:hypothetical protein
MMNKYHEALQDIKLGIRDVSFYRNSMDVIQKLVDEKLEQESRKDKLIVGSQWECVFECFGENRHYDVKDNVVINKIFNLYGTYINVGHGQIDDNIPEQQFLLCFKPRKVEVE